MSTERRIPFALLRPNAKPAPTPVSASVRVPISRPRRPTPAAHHHHAANAGAYPYPQHYPQKRYATMLPRGSSSSSSSLDSFAPSLAPRRRKLSAAEDVAARVRARWAALEALERPSTSPEKEKEKEQELEQEKEKENVVPAPEPMQVDELEKPLPPAPAPFPPPTRVPVPDFDPALMVLDIRSDAGGDAPATDSTLRTSPTSVTFVEGEPDTDEDSTPLPPATLRAPQVHRRPSVNDELEEAREEATLAMLHTTRTDGQLRCPRRGCGALLGGVSALTFHLHIHAVGVRAGGAPFSCARCGGAFESAREIARHACARRRARERLRCVVRAWTCRPPTGAVAATSNRNYYY
ncbi:hypothetical protein BC834DRAFT_60730 [Gloeopeniophorella convolvens]|nr:hypothetical protein BC834DRAFT_60730 [Gloeopeniophorella convolvens]